MSAFLYPLIAAGTSFLMAKATGASNKSALASGIMAAAGAYGTAQLGQGISGSRFAGPSPMSLPGGGVGNVPVTGQQKFVSGLGTALQSPTAQIGIGTTLGTIPPAMEAERRAKDAAGMIARPFGGEEEYKRQYEMAQADLSGIGDRINYGEEPQRNVYDFSGGMYRLREGGIADIAHYRKGGVNYLPSKSDHDENDYGNYVRAEGYVEDGSGNGDKDEDTMLAQLADGEFVSRADAVLGAGIMSGANPNDFKEMRSKGAKYFYNQQDQLKRIYDMVT